MKAGRLLRQGVHHMSGWAFTRSPGTPISYCLILADDFAARAVLRGIKVGPGTVAGAIHGEACDREDG